MKLKKILAYNDLLINDLKNQEFKHINKYNYYDSNDSSKASIKIFLKDIRKKYNLKNVSLSEKALVDGLQARGIFNEKV